VPKNILGVEEDIAAMEHGANVLSHHAKKLQGKVPDEEVAKALWNEIGRIKFAAWFLSEHAQAKRFALAKAKADAEAAKPR